MAALYNSQGAWLASTQYNYLDAVTYNRLSYICTESNGSLNQNPTQFPLVWVQMPQITQEDQYYLRTRESLLQYEDARFNSLINAMANYYTTRNDQSVWGSFLRAVAMELARIEYMYSYDVVAKNPSFLTPPDIKREYADPLFITGSFQQSGQFDSGDFGASFANWTADIGIILGAAILDSNGNIQVCTTVGTTGLTEPQWALSLGATTTDGNVVWTNYGPAPEVLAYPIGYRDMLVDLLAAYQEGATAKSIQDVIYAYTGKQIIVEELYKEIVPGGFYDQSDRNAVKVSVNVGGTDPLTDVQSLTELQQITNSLYGAIDLAKPAHVGLEFTTIFGADENIDCYISPRYLTQFQLNTLSEAQSVYYVLIGYVLSQLTVTGWSPQTFFAAGSVIQDTNGNIQLAIASGPSGATKPTWNATLQGITEEGITSPPTSPPSALEWVNIGTPQITIAAYQALSTTQKAVYQAYYQNLNCNGAGIDDTLQIIIQQIENPPFDPMLYQAPIFDPANPTTTLASYGRILLAPLSPTNWALLSNNPPVWGSVTTYNKGDLVRGRNWMIPGTTSPAMPGGWQLYRAKKKNTGHDPLTDASQTYWIPLSSPSIYQAYYQAPNGQYVIGIRQWAPTTSFYVGQFMLDNNGNLQIATVVAAPVTSPPTPSVSSIIAVSDPTSPSAVVVNNNSVTIAVTTTNGMGLVAGSSSVTLLGFTYATFLNGLTLPVTSFTATSITMPLTHSNYASGGLLETGTAQIGFNTTTNGITYDGSIIWTCLGLNYLNNPAKWIQVVDSNNNVTGEVANWDVTHPMGLLAPRTDLVWEISGGDTFSSYEME